MNQKNKVMNEIQTWEPLSGFYFKLPRAIIKIEKLLAQEKAYAIIFPGGKTEILSKQQMGFHSLKMVLSSCYNEDGNPIRKKEYTEFMSALNDKFGVV